jgi:hypothetical protein
MVHRRKLLAGIVAAAGLALPRPLRAQDAEGEEPEPQEPEAEEPETPEDEPQEGPPADPPPDRARLKCKNTSCTCTVAAGEKFCGVHCQSTENTIQVDCTCGHEECGSVF